MRAAMQRFATATRRIVAAQMGVRIRVTTAWECARALSAARAHGEQREGLLLSGARARHGGRIRGAKTAAHFRKGIS